MYTKSSPSNEIFTGMVLSLSCASFASIENNALFPAPLRPNTSSLSPRLISSYCLVLMK